MKWVIEEYYFAHMSGDHSLPTKVHRDIEGATAGEALAKVTTYKYSTRRDWNPDAPKYPKWIVYPQKFYDDVYKVESARALATVDTLEKLCY